MMIRETIPEDIRQLAELQYQSYSNFRLDLTEFRKRTEERFFVPGRTTYVGMEAGQLVASYALIDYLAYVAGKAMRCGGIASVAIALDRRRRGLAHQLLRHALDRMLEREMHISMLHPFRYDFYAHLGWGLMSEICEHSFVPAALRKCAEGNSVRSVTATDRDGLAACYEHMAQRRNGMMKRSSAQWDVLIESSVSRLFAYHGLAGIEAYALLELEQDPRMEQPLATLATVLECVYSSTTGIRAIASFLSTLGDQVTRIRWLMPPDVRLELLTHDPTNGLEQVLGRSTRLARRIGVNAMFRVVDVRAALLERAHYNGETFCVRLELKDAARAQNEHPVVLSVDEAGSQLEGEPQGTVSMDISTFSQLFSGYVSLTDALHAGLASCSNEGLVPIIDRAFHSSLRPVCMTYF